MIWVWICAAWLLSFVALKNKKIDWRHLIWFMLPVDMYGITIGGVTIKPYMLFCLLILLRNFVKGEVNLRFRSKWSVTTGILVFLMVIVNMVNNGSISSIISASLLPVVWLCSNIYTGSVSEKTEDEIPDVLLAVGIGFGAVFSLACLLHSFDIDLFDMVARTRMKPGIIMRFYNMRDGVLVRSQRLRGFSIDPNTMGPTFFISTIVAVLRIMNRKAGFREFLALVLGVICIIQSNSRMGMICMALIVLVCIAVGYRMGDSRVRNWTKAGFLLLGATLVVLCVTGALDSMFASFMSQFENRSGLSDEYGRLTIWQESISVLLEKNPLLGIGFGQMQYLTEMNRATHNTWLEILAAGGFLVGGMLVVQFAVLAYAGVRCSLDNTGGQNQEFVWTMSLGLLAVMVSLFAVDHLMYSYLWFGAAILATVTSGSRRGL